MNVKPPARMCGVRFIGSKCVSRTERHRFKVQMRVEKGDPVQRFQRSKCPPDICAFKGQTYVLDPLIVNNLLIINIRTLQVNRL